MKLSSWIGAGIVFGALVAAAAPAMARVTPTDATRICREAALAQITPAPSTVRVLDVRNTPEGMRVRLLFLEQEGPNRRAACLIDRDTETPTVTLTE